jgi:hypothetical protein
VVIENARRTLARLESDVGLPLLDQEVADAIQASLPQRQQNLMRVLAILNDIPGSQGLASEDPIADSMRVVVHDALDDLLYCQDEPFDDPEATLQVRDEALSELERRFPRMARTIGE